MTARNTTLLEGFDWHTPSTPPAPHETHSSTSHHARLKRLLGTFGDLGITTIWLPPSCKANNPGGNGYDCYDLWDLGEFDQKWTRSTKWGSREELDDLIREANRRGLNIIWDAVLNHKTAGDATHECWAVEVDPNDRRREVCHPKKIEAWLKYDFPGRGEQYSALKWRAEHFNGTDWDQRRERHAIYKLIDKPRARPGSGSGSRPTTSMWKRLRSIINRDSIPPSRPGKDWAADVDDAFGNHDYLMFSNIDYSHPAVKHDVIAWSKWMLQDIGVSGFRLDAAKHISRSFIRQWVGEAKLTAPECFIVGEVWSAEMRRILAWLDAVGKDVHAFDVPLLTNFSRVSQAVEAGIGTDLRRMIQGTLLQSRPATAVTVVTNHDTQPGQESFTPMNAQLKTIFYAYILLRQEGVPCVFWGDLYGTNGPRSEPPACVIDGRSVLPDLMLARKLFAYGDQKDYFDEAPCIAWVRAGTHDRPSCVVMVSIASVAKEKRIAAGKPGQFWVDILASSEHRQPVQIDRKGFGRFSCEARRAAVYVNADEPGVSRFPVQIDRALAQ